MVKRVANLNVIYSLVARSTCQPLLRPTRPGSWMRIHLSAAAAHACEATHNVRSRIENNWGREILGASRWGSASPAIHAQEPHIVRRCHNGVERKRCFQATALRSGVVA